MTRADLDGSVLSRLSKQIGSAKVEQIVELFRENVRLRQDAALQAFRTDDQYALSVALHSIKGSAQLVGASRLEAVAARWEEKAQAGEIDSIEEGLAEIQSAFGAVEKELGLDVKSANEPG